MAEGWVSFHRKIKDWEWYTDSNTFRLFFHLVLMANHKPNKWKGIEINRGQLVVGRKQLASELKLSEQQIRTSFNKLKSTNEITTKSTNKYTLVTIINYDVYQSDEKKVTNKKTNEKPTNNQQITTNNNDNNEKNKYTTEFEELYKSYPRSENKAQTFNNYKKLLKRHTHEDLLKCVNLYIAKVKKEKTEKQYMINSSNFFGKRAVYEDYLDENYEEPAKPNIIEKSTGVEYY